jgi:hypothetical protein
MIRSGFERRAATRFSGFRSTYLEIRDHLPADARVLLHNHHISLGVDREVYLDGVGYQGLISYDRLRSPAETYDYMRKLGITHLLYEPDLHRASTKQQEIMFAALTHYGEQLGRFGSYRLLRMPDRRPLQEAPYRVAVTDLEGYADGVYPIEAMNTDEYLPLPLRHFARPQQPLPEDAEARKRALGEVNALLVGTDLAGKLPLHELSRLGFVRVARVENLFTLYLKQP